MPSPPPNATEWQRVRNETAAPYPRDVNLASLVDSRAHAQPSAPAIHDGNRIISYAELIASADAVGCSLRALGISCGDRVGILAPRSAEAIAAMVGILKIGATYVPLDPEVPPYRNLQYANAINLKAVTTTPPHSSPLPALPSLTIEIKRHSAPCLPRDEYGAAYVMFTSGTTGVPKAVPVTHRAIARLVINANWIQISKRDRIIHAAPLSFDASTFEIWGALLNGACLIIASRETLLDAEEMSSFIRRHEISIAWMTATAFHFLAGENPAAFAGLRYLLAGGEALNPRIVRSVARCCQATRLINGYGPTENTTFSAVHHVEYLPESATKVPIGRPISNSTCWVLRDDGATAEIGEIGELHVGGDGVALGYMNDHTLTSRRFIPDPFSPVQGARLFKTGDLALWTYDGILEFHGRRDGQVKIRGFRVELEAIEVAIAQHPFVIAASVTKPSQDAQSLRACVTTSDPNLTATELKEFLRKYLPIHEIPGSFELRSELALTVNGKLDRSITRDN